ncbi:DUF2087 domain-containing protein [Rhizobium sp. LCM 4573]|uniref:DUF2087 domain-containing protein n=1 Tax=Rhizobium sp. LCM 4573 TaxID=1848291 RepID=UPI0008D9C1AA|nr:DUF2087 domain-containing protein [Rhizobium sp. LCM 4573]OHV76523.1 hypothetical protein LCM4573_12990 [Rhizobium sp. LCM 4573]
MPRSIFSMEIADLSAFAKSIRNEIDKLERKPSHVETLNLLTRAAGFRNFQHFRATRKTAEVLQEWNVTSEAPPAPDEARVLKTLRVFDREGRITRWPTKRSQQELCLWFLWSKIPSGRIFSEREISEFLNTLHLFGDAALLRRDLFDLGLVTRKRDGSDYRRIDKKKQPPELGLLLRRVAAKAAEVV